MSEINPNSPQTPPGGAETGTQPKPAIGRGTKTILTVAVALIALIAVFALVAPKLFPAPAATSAEYTGSWVDGEQSLEIRPDGSASGTDGCNGQGSSWSFEGDGIVFEGFIGTMMACLDADGKYEQGWLPRSVSAVLQEDNKLHFFDADANEIGVMVRGEITRKPAPSTEDSPLAPGTDPGMTTAPEPRPSLIVPNDPTVELPNPPGTIVDNFPETETE